MTETLFVRLRPYSPRRGYFVQRYHDGENVYIGGIYPRWYRVTPEKAAQLEGQKQDPNNIESRPMFEVVDESSRKHIDDEEENLRLASLNVYTREGAQAVPPNPKGVPIDLTKARAAAIPAGSGDVTTEAAPASARGKRSETFAP